MCTKIIAVGHKLLFKWWLLKEPFCFVDFTNEVFIHRLLCCRFQTRPPSPFTTVAFLQTSQDGQESVASTLMTEEDNDDRKEIMGSTASLETVESEDLSEVTEGTQSESSLQQDDYVNPRGVRFTPQEPVKEGTE